MITIKFKPIIKDEILYESFKDEPIDFEEIKRQLVEALQAKEECGFTEPLVDMLYR